MWVQYVHRVRTHLGHGQCSMAGGAVIGAVGGSRLHIVFWLAEGHTLGKALLA